MKIPEGVTRRKILKVIQALWHTLRSYEENLHDPSNCELCRVAGLMPKTKQRVAMMFQIFNCELCPWVWFTGVACDEFYEKKDPNINACIALSQVRRDAGVYVKYRENRKRQIKRWISRLEKELSNGLFRG